MKCSDVNFSDLILHSEECGEEVGYSDVRIVGLYSNQSQSCFYYIDASTKKVLDGFPIEEDDDE